MEPINQKAKVVQLIIVRIILVFTVIICIYLTITYLHKKRPSGDLALKSTILIKETIFDDMSLLYFVFHSMLIYFVTLGFLKLSYIHYPPID